MKAVLSEGEKAALIKEYISLYDLNETRGHNAFRDERIKEIENSLGMIQEEILKGRVSISDCVDCQTC